MILQALTATALLIDLAGSASATQASAESPPGYPWPEANQHEANQHNVPIPGARPLAEPRGTSQEAFAAKERQAAGTSANEIPDMGALLVQIKDAENPEARRSMILMYLEGAEMMAPEERRAALRGLEEVFR